ncbi:MAG: hypothetical protein ABJH68_09145 [Ilumatobacter sp.]|uniref:hypothetical protein n=1 Tax=Ilumatobacter sp. TaxID=1967498 RepID=UPI0032972B13
MTEGARRIGVIGVATVIAVGLVCVGSTPGSARQPAIGSVVASEHAERAGNVYQVPVAPGRVTIVADSVLSGISAHGELDRLVGTRWDVRMEPCRRLVSPSCTYGRGTAAPTVLEELQAIARAGGATGTDDVLLIATGHNDSDSRLRDEVGAIMQASQRAGFERVAWTLYRDQADASLPVLTQSLFAVYGRMNAVLRAEASSGRWPLVVLEYGEFTRGQPEWFTADGIHLTREGAVHLADWLSWVIRYDHTPALRP